MTTRPLPTIARAISGIEELAGAFLHDATRTERLLWLVVLLAFTGDVLLTYYGLQHGLQEGNPVMALAFESAGFAILGLVKALALGTGGLLRAYAPKYRVVTPLGLALPWAVAVAINLAHLAG